eukprot:4095993-Lingulodinium_polyedra.AAC.1
MTKATAMTMMTQNMAITMTMRMMMMTMTNYNGLPFVRPFYHRTRHMPLLVLLGRLGHNAWFTCPYR